MKWITNVATVFVIGCAAINTPAIYAGKYGTQKLGGNRGNSGSSQQMQKTTFNFNKSMQQKSSMSKAPTWQPMLNKGAMTNGSINHSYKYGTKPAHSKTTSGNSGTKHLQQNFASKLSTKKHDDHHDDHHHGHGHHHHHHHLPWWAVAPIPRVPVVVSRPVFVSRPVVLERQARFVTPESPMNELPQLTPGMQTTIRGEELGNNRGQVLLRVNDLTLPMEVLSWTTDAATVQVPSMALNAATKAQIAVVRSDGSLARTIDVRLSADTSSKL